jgi:hypothetical protein
MFLLFLTTAITFWNFNEYTITVICFIFLKF